MIFDKKDNIAFKKEINQILEKAHLKNKISIEEDRIHEIASCDPFGADGNMCMSRFCSLCSTLQSKYEASELTFITEKLQGFDFLLAQFNGKPCRLSELEIETRQVVEIFKKYNFKKKFPQIFGYKAKLFIKTEEVKNRYIPVMKVLFAVDRDSKIDLVGKAVNLAYSMSWGKEFVGFNGSRYVQFNYIHHWIRDQENVIGYMSAPLFYLNKKNVNYKFLTTLYNMFEDNCDFIYDEMFIAISELYQKEASRVGYRELA